MENSRRDFLKKIIYKAPVIVALGTLAAPVSKCAASSHISIGSNPFPTDEKSESSNGGLN